MIIAILEPNDAVRKLVADYIREWFPTSDIYPISTEVELEALRRDLELDYVVGGEEHPILKPVIKKELRKIFEPVTSSDLN